jgi:hypothetical protein
MFLTKLQTQELTGYKIPSAQIRWLQKNGILFKVGADGYPRVLVTEVETQMLSNSKPTKNIIRQETPNFEALYGKKA